MHHKACGEEFSPVMHCRACGAGASTTCAARSGRAAASPGRCRRPPPGAGRRRLARPGAASQTIELIGNRWSASAMAAAFLGARRFTDMLTMMGAPPAIVSDRLHTFCRIGVLETRLTSATRRVEYRLTDKGRAFFPHVMVMLNWGDKWFRAPERPATLLSHTSCGGEFGPSCTARSAAWSCTDRRSRSAASRPRPRLRVTELSGNGAVLGRCCAGTSRQPPPWPAP